jgi:cupin 2 domain-containing protein
MAMISRGRLGDGYDAPAVGERVSRIAESHDLVVEEIVAGRFDVPVDYLQDHDEWVLLVAGAALLEVDGEPLRLAPSDWAMLPAGTPHRLVSSEPGTHWVTISGRDRKVASTEQRADP